MNRPAHLAVALAAAALAAAGCSSPSTLDRTQPNFTKKSDLTNGTWYWHESIVDAPKTPGGLVIGSYGGMEKIRWEVQEDLLVGYRSYEIVPGADPRVDRDKSSIGDVVFQDGRPYKGNPVVAYKIQSHFDRQRMYNASTGEQSNQLVEDTADRPWYEREYMRVDWKSNVVNNVQSCTTPTGVGCSLFGGGTKGTALHYVTAQDQTQNDEAMVTENDSEGKLKYFDFTTQVVMDPPSVYYEGYGDIPYCLFSPTYDCESMNVKIRTSVMRVDPERVKDYEPLVYNDKLMVKFGFYRNTAYSYDKDYYYTYSGTQYFAMRHNIWAQSKERRVDPVTNEIKLVPIPVTRRPLRPIVYYMTANTPKELWSAASQRWAKEAGSNEKDTIEASWDHAFRRAVAVPRGLEVSDVPQMFYVCESPVQKGAPEACGKEGTFARMGDLRYNTIPYVTQNAGGLLGLGPSMMDPETGEAIHSAANIYGVGLDWWAGSSQQVMDVLNGDISLDDLVLGNDVKEHVFTYMNPTDPRRPATGPWTSQQPLTSDSTRPMSSMSRTTGHLQDLMSVWKDKGSMPLARENRKAVVEQLIKDHPALEDELINLPEVRVGVNALSMDPGFQAKLAADPQFYRQVARNLLLGNDPIEKERQSVLSQVGPRFGCYYQFSYSDEDYIGVAKRKQALQRSLITKYQTSGDPSCANKASCTAAEAKTLARAEVYNDLRREAYRSIATHEIGHTHGLFHNFIASADALNYMDGYWDLRKETIGVNVAGKRVLPVTPQNMVDAAKQNQHQLDEDMYEYTYSSIMDYGARVNSGNKGTGKYDDAAILFGYAGGYEPGWVEVFNETRNDYEHPNIVMPVDNAAKVFTVRGAQVEIPLAIAEHYTPYTNLYTDKYHYTTLPFHFADQNPDFAVMLDQGIRRMNNRSFRKWSEMEKYYERIAQEVKNYTLSEGGLQETDYVRAGNIIRAAGGRNIPVEVPYMFCSDYEVGANLLCNRNDQGADVYEMTSKWLERFNQSYVFSNFRRDRLGYSPAAVASGKFGRYLGNVPNVYQQWLFNTYYLQRYYSLTTEDLDRYFGLGDPIYQNYWTMAVVDSTNTLMQQLAVPSIGYHGKRADGNWEYVGSGDPQNRRLSASAEAALITQLAQPANGGYTDVLYVPRGPGRSMYTVYDTTGYDNFTRVNEAGHFWDVYAAMLALTTSETNFLGVDRGSDALRYSLPYYLTFNHELAPLFSAYWTQAPEKYAPSIGKMSDGTGYVQLPVFLKARDYIYGFDYPVPLPTPVDNASLAMTKVLPNPTWSARFYAQVWGMAYFTDNYNQEFANFNRIYRLGSNENLTPAPGFEVVSFTDPFGGGYIYAALVKTGDTNPPAGPSLVQRANEWKAKWDAAASSGTPVDGLTAAQWEQKVRDTVRTLEMMRGLFDIFGRAI